MTAAHRPDGFDRAIPAILQRDNATPPRRTTDVVHLSAPAAQRRIKRVQETGILRARRGQDVPLQRRRQGTRVKWMVIRIGLPSWLKNALDSVIRSRSAATV